MARRRDIPRDEILDAAQQLMETRGCNGFSMRDLGDEVGLRAASLHYHFPAKADLLAAVVRRCRERLNARLAEIEAETDALAVRLERVAALISPPPDGGLRLCLLTVMAADVLTLPPGPNDETRQLAANLLGWLARFVSQAKADGELPPAAEPDSIAAFLLAAVQGALLLERAGPPGIAARALGHALSSVSSQEKQA